MKLKHFGFWTSNESGTFLKLGNAENGTYLRCRATVKEGIVNTPLCIVLFAF